MGVPWRVPVRRGLGGNQPGAVSVIMSCLYFSVMPVFHSEVGRRIQGRRGSRKQEGQMK